MSENLLHSVDGRQAVLCQGKNGLPVLRLRSELSEADIYLNGATVTHFKPRGGEPILFTSAHSRFVPEKPIRGGVPIIFPWFGNRDGHAAHGLVRDREWTVAGWALTDDGGIEAILRTVSRAEDEFPFELIFRVRAGEHLNLALEVIHHHHGDLPLETCLHTYFSVGDARQVEITGLEDTEFLDKVQGLARRREGREPIRIVGETDRVYLDTGATVEIIDPVWKRRIRVEKTESRSTVVWNPWVEKSRRLEDLGDDEFPQFVCVESGNVAENRLVVPPETTVTLGVRISSRPL